LKERGLEEGDKKRKEEGKTQGLSMKKKGKV